MSISKLPADWYSVLNDLADAHSLISYEDFSQLALYHPKLGYYTSNKNRIGKSLKSDFYTSTSHNEVFPLLLSEAVETLLLKHEMAAKNFIEIGAEPNNSTFDQKPSWVSSRKTLHLGDSFEIPNSSVVYSNELFDAQPFQRWVCRDGFWSPISLQIKNHHLLETIEARELSASEQIIQKRLPPPYALEYHLDIPYQAETLLKSITDPQWEGLFVAIDYGKSWQQLIKETPQGTARAYHKHEQVDELYLNPGQMDLTTDVCWDFLEQVLVAAGFENISRTRQAKFFLDHSPKTIEAIASAEENLTSKRKGQLLELISPGFFGQRFEVLTAIRKN